MAPVFRKRNPKDGPSTDKERKEHTVAWRNRRQEKGEAAGGRLVLPLTGRVRQPGHSRKRGTQGQAACLPSTRKG